jgi:hypothetical protein
VPEGVDVVRPVDAPEARRISERYAGNVQHLCDVLECSRWKARRSEDLDAVFCG